MHRNISRLTDVEYDLLVVGGGIYGACLAWEAVSRGLSIALIEKGDFGAATSANSLKTIHGGLRYLQHADFKRMRESIRERRTLLRIAPHLVHPLPILVPTYGHGLKGREAMAIALRLNDLISCDRNWQVPNQDHHLPTGKILSKDQCLAKALGVNPYGLTGGAFFCDAQVYNSERLTLAFLHSAHSAGAQIANYVKLIDFLRKGEQIQGAIVQDELTGSECEIRAQCVVNAAGPWVQQIATLATSEQPSNSRPTPFRLAKAVNFVVPPLFQECAVGLQSQSDPDDANSPIDKGGRFLFIVPWRNFSMVGTWYFPYTHQNLDELSATQEEIEICLADINNAYPLAKLSFDDIHYIHSGLLPSCGVSKSGEVILEKHYTINTHQRDGIQGLISVSGVKYTTARDVAVKVIDRVFKALGRSKAASKTHQIPLFGGNCHDLIAFQNQIHQNYGEHIMEQDLQQLVYHYGTETEKLLEQATVLLKQYPQADDFQAALLISQVLYGVHEEMAIHLTDVVLRRTGLGSAGHPGNEELALCADVMAAVLDWSEQRHQMELAQVKNFYARQFSRPSLLANLGG